MVIEKKLNCGIRMIMEEIPYVQSAAVGIWVKAGSVDENEANYGISHLIEHMLFKGTENRTAKQIASDCDRIGGHMNAFTGKEATCYYIKTLGSNLEKACEILIDMFTNSKFDPDELEKEKQVIYEEIKMIEDSPEDDVHDILTEIVFRGTDLESSVIGTREILAKQTRETILEYIGEEYTRDNIVVSLAGSFDGQAMCEFFENKLSCLVEKKKDRDKPLLTADYVPASNVKIKDVEQSHLCIGLKGLPLDHKLYYAMAILNNIMGGSMSSRLFQNIREEKGLAYAIFSSSSSYVNDGVYSIYAGVGHDKVGDTIKAIAEELHILKAKGITDDELLTAKEQLKSSYTFSQENVNSRLFSNGRNTLLLGKVYTPAEVIDKVNKVNMDDIRQVAQLIAEPERCSGSLITRSDFDLEGALRC